jgi:hypothetical protein
LREFNLISSSRKMVLEDASGHGRFVV